MEIKLAVRTGSQQDNSAANDPGKFAILSAFSKNFGRSEEREKLKPPRFIDRRKRKVRCGNRSRRLLAWISHKERQNASSGVYPSIIVES